ncbi:MAG: RrF2 family transcriptional regulator [Candidatus Omnitrophica bacterium]|nr:RrF2 family transcriptional regulator [Candidatus Omnitrophota bacterium]
MKLSTKGRYGTRLMLDLAIHYNNGPVLLKDIARRQAISEKYLGQLIRPLMTAKLVKSSRGAHGGYFLAKPPKAISLADIMEPLEGSLAIVECIDTPGICPRVKHCVTREIWKEITDKVIDTLKNFTLQDLVAGHNKKHKNLIYNI